MAWWAWALVAWVVLSFLVAVVVGKAMRRADDHGLGHHGAQEKGDRDAA